jgi:hypothetical protein
MFAQNPRQFLMNGILCRGRHSEIDDACPYIPKKNQFSKIPVSRDKNPGLLASCLEQFGIAGSCETDFGDGHHIVPKTGKKLNC